MSVTRGNRDWMARFASVAAAGLLAVSLAFRFLWLDRLPGVNGDEAWYGVQLLHLLRGEPWSAWTPSGLPINPFLFLTELPLLAAARPTFWILRLPIAIWACVAIGLTYVLHRWVFADREQSVALATLTACLPIHLAYSRFCWDSSFGFVTVPLVLYATLKLAERSRDNDGAAWCVFAAGAVLTLWVHVTNAVFVLASALVVLWAYRGEVWNVVRRGPITASTVLFAAFIGSVFLVRESSRAWQLVVSVGSSLNRLPDHLRAVADILWGVRVYEYLAGAPRGAALPVYAVALALMVLVAVALVGSAERRDRHLLALAGLTLLGVLLVGRALDLDETSCERYVLYVAPLFALVCVRGVSCLSVAWRFRAVSVAPPLLVSTLFLVQFWQSYFVPLRAQANADRLHRTFRTGEIEPKQAVATAISDRAGGERAPIILFEDWWVRYPIEFALGGECRPRTATAAESMRPAFIVGFAGSAFMEHVAAWSGADRAERIIFPDGAGRPHLELIALDPADSRRGQVF